MRSNLIKFNKAQLEELDFGGLQAFCTVQLHSFEFVGGDARVSLSTRSLRGAPEALKFISEYPFKLHTYREVTMSYVFNDLERSSIIYAANSCDGMLFYLESEAIYGSSDSGAELCFFL